MDLTKRNQGDSVHDQHLPQVRLSPFRHRGSSFRHFRPLAGTVSAKADPLALIFGGQQQRAAFSNAYAYAPTAAPSMPVIEEEEATSQPRCPRI